VWDLIRTNWKNGQDAGNVNNGEGGRMGGRFSKWEATGGRWWQKGNKAGGDGDPRRGRGRGEEVER